VQLHAIDACEQRTWLSLYPEFAQAGASIVVGHLGLEWRSVFHQRLGVYTKNIHEKAGELMCARGEHRCTLMLCGIFYKQLRVVLPNHPGT